MSHCPRWTLILLCCFFLFSLAPAAQEEFQVLPEKSYRLDLPARKPNEKEFTRDTRNVSADVFLDKKAQRLFYVGEAGNSLAVVASGKGVGEGEGKGAKWVQRLVLPIRKWDDKDFGKEPATVGVEVYRDERTANWVYVSHTCSLTVLPADKDPVGKPGQEPQWLHRMRLQVRLLREVDFYKHRYNVEVYHDEYTGGQLYVAENGSLAVIPAAKATEGKEISVSEWSHALELQVRQPGQEKFTADSARHGTEVYQDKNRGAWIYITESLQLAVVPGNKDVGEKIQVPKWLQGLRPPAGAPKQWSAEVYHNPNTDHQVYVTAAGALAVLPSK
jgi:hypothetical protein